MRTRAFKSVVSKYDVVFFDSYGVLKTAEGLIPGVPETLHYLHERDIDYFVLTNDASRGPHELAEKFHQLGVPEIDEHKIISSGMLAKEYLRYKVKRGTVAYLGTEASAHYIERPNLHTLPIKDLDPDDVEHINALVFLDDEGFDWSRDLNRTVNLLRKRNIPAIIANTDRTYPIGHTDVAIAVGGLANLIEHVLGKTFIRFGKPDAQMFHFAYQHVSNGRSVSKERILMVGDTLSTDIIGGNKFGIDTALVLTGNTLPDQARLNIRTRGIIPDYICESVAID